MKGKIALIVGLGVGYVLGSRAGRKRYEEIKLVANRVWNSDSVQKPLEQAEGFARQLAPELTEKLIEGSNRLAETTRALVENLTTNAAEVSAEAEALAEQHEAAVEAGGKPARNGSSGAKTAASRTASSRTTAKKPAARKPAAKSTAAKSTTAKSSGSAS